MTRPNITRVSNLEIKSDTRNKQKGLHFDQLTTTQRNAITTINNGLGIYNTDTNTLQTYQNAAWVNLNTSGSLFALKRTATAANYQALITDVIIGVTDTSVASRLITLPAVATTIAGQIITVKDESGAIDGTHIITVDGSGAETIDGAAAKTITAAYGSVQLYSSGTAWFTF